MHEHTRGMICAANHMYSGHNEETYAFEILEICGEIDINEVDEYDKPMVEKFLEYKGNRNVSITQ